VPVAHPGAVESEPLAEFDDPTVPPNMGVANAGVLYS
jgi:hypothetical protein